MNKYLFHLNNYYNGVYSKCWINNTLKMVGGYMVGLFETVAYL